MGKNTGEYCEKKLAGINYYGIGHNNFITHPHYLDFNRSFFL